MGLGSLGPSYIEVKIDFRDEFLAAGSLYQLTDYAAKQRIYRGLEELQ